MFLIFKKFRFTILTLVIAALAIGVVLYRERQSEPNYDFVVAKRADLVQEVSVTGKVEPAQEVELAFERSGKVAQVKAAVGARVAAGQILVSLNNLDLVSDLNRAAANAESARAQLLQYQAALEREKAKLDELKSGTRPEEINVYETKVNNARAAVVDALLGMIDDVRDAYTKADDSVRNKTDQFFDFPRSASPQLKFNTSQQIEINLESQRIDMERILVSWQKSLETISVPSAPTHRAEAKEYLDQIKLFLDRASFAVNQLTPTVNLTQTTIDGWKVDAAAARANVNTALANLTAAEEQRQDAEAALAVAEGDLRLKQAGSTPDQVSAQAAAVRQAEANVVYQEAQVKASAASVQNARAQLDKTLMRAPFAGLVTKQEAKVGAIISANTTVVSLISPVAYKIEANVPEVDIAKLMVGNTAEVTLDAYGNDMVFAAKVAAVDPAETIIDGVSTYRVTFQFAEFDERLKSGMTANVEVMTQKREGVVAVPARAIVRGDGKTIVRVLRGAEAEEVEVETGLRGADGNVEIVSGVSEGEKVLVSQ